MTRDSSGQSKLERLEQAQNVARTAMIEDGYFPITLSGNGDSTYLAKDMPHGKRHIYEPDGRGGYALRRIIDTPAIS